MAQAIVALSGGGRLLIADAGADDSAKKSFKSEDSSSLTSPTLLNNVATEGTRQTGLIAVLNGGIKLPNGFNDMDAQP